MTKFADDCYIMTNRKIQEALYSIANEYCDQDEIVYVAIKGAHKEYLLATNKRIYIYKTGFMTRKTFGYSLFRLEYDAITAVQINRQFGGVGFIEVIGLGMQNRENLSYWSSNKGNDAAEADNTLTFGGNIKVYEEAVSLINKLMTENRYPSNSINNSTVNKLDKFEELKKYKELLDLNIISQDEFDQKKKEFMGN